MSLAPLGNVWSQQRLDVDIQTAGPGIQYRLEGSLLLPTPEEPLLIQIYFVVDAVKQADRRRAIIPLTESTVLALQRLVHDHNPYAIGIKCAMDKLT